MKKIILINLFILLFLAQSYSQQCSDHNHSLEQRVKESSLIIEGKIINQESYFDENRKSIFTKHEIEVYKIFKGNATNILVMHTNGGTVGNNTLTVSHQEHFSSGQESIFFLDENRKGKIMPNFGTITFCPEYFKYNASDFHQSYPDVEIDLYNPLQIEAGQSFRKIKNNSLEKSIEDWLSSVNMYRDDCQTTLEYAIRNKTISYPYFEFDITAKTDIQELYLKNTKIIMEYASSLGSSFVLNGKVEVTKDELIDNLDYILLKSDVTPQKFSIDIENSNLSTLKEIKQHEKKLCHIKMEIVASSEQLSGLVSFDNASMEGQSAYLNPEVAGLQDFDCVLADNSAMYAATDFTFYPDTVNAGIRDTLYIAGNDFGPEGKVYLRNASQTNPLAQDYFAAIRPDRVEWSDNLIKVDVLSLSNVNAVSNPGSGPIKLELADSTIVENSDGSEVEVFYSIVNVGQDERRKNLADKDGNGGYTFHLGTELSNTPNARAVIQQILDDWHEKTCVNFSLATETIDNPINAKDSLNVIFFDTLVGTTLMETYSHLDGQFFNGSGMLAAWINDIDIIIDSIPSKPWFIDLDSIGNDTMYDFYAAFSHEIGHAHQLNHVLGEQSDGINKLMYPTRSSGYETRYIGSSAEKGGLNIMANNPIELNGGSAAPPMTNHESCVINSIYYVGEDKFGEISIFPNPTSNFLTIDYELTEASEVIFSVIDLSGKTIINKPIGQKYKGEYLEYINTSKLPQGMYFLKIQSQNGFSTIKFIKR